MMARLLQLAFFATLALLALAAPAPGPARSLTKRSFKAHAPGRRILSAMEDRARVERKYRKHWEIIVAGSGASSSSSVTTSTITAYPTVGPPSYGNSSFSTSTSSAPAAHTTTASEDGSVSATPEDSSEISYLSPVTIGGQKFNLDFDTGSADLWVYAKGATTMPVAFFEPNTSSTWKRLSSETFSITYGDGSGATGFVGTDVVDIGGSTVQKQAVEVAQDVIGNFDTDPNTDGLLGLSFSSINSVVPTPQLTFFDNVKSDLTLPLFTANLEESTGKGTYDFGTIDESKYSGDIHYAHVNDSAGFWQFTTPTTVIDGKVHDCSNCSQAILDTGTSLMYMDPDVVARYYSNVPKATLNEYYGLYVYPCTEAKNLPSFGAGVGDWIAHINGPDMNYAPMSKTSTTCVGGLQAVSYNMPGAILGDVFLKQFFAVFDAGKNGPRVGVANKG